MAKLFGSSSTSRFSQKSAPSQTKKRKKEKKPRSRLRPLKVLLSILLALEILYCLAIFTSIPIISDLRTMYIKTAMSTMRHQWLATALIPSDIVDDVVQRVQAAREEQVGMTSSWDALNPSTDSGSEPDETADPGSATAPTEEALTQEQLDFFKLYWELDMDSVQQYVKAHPEAVKNGWDKFYVNKAGLDDDGTTMKTTMGESVLAIDAENQILLLRVSGTTYRGVLAVCKDPSRLSLCLPTSFGSRGQCAGKIAESNNGLVAITASGFLDEGGTGNGGEVAGACMSDGKSYGRHFGWGYKRVELHEDDRLYITDAPSRFSEGTTDASEFWPALIINGENALGADNIFTELNPRACLGQSRSGEILMLVIEGRLITSLGATAETCTEILLRHDCYQAMNMDGGTSAIMWYDGEYVTRCSNTALDEGRTLPNAWVYKAAE